MSVWDATIKANKRSYWLPERARYTYIFRDFQRWLLNKERFSRSCYQSVIGHVCLIKVAGLWARIVSVLESESKETKTPKKSKTKITVEKNKQ